MVGRQAVLGVEVGTQVLLWEVEGASLPLVASHGGEEVQVS